MTPAGKTGPEAKNKAVYFSGRCQMIRGQKKRGRSVLFMVLFFRILHRCRGTVSFQRMAVFIKSKLVM